MPAARIMSEATVWTVYLARRMQFLYSERTLRKTVLSLSFVFPRAMCPGSKYLAISPEKLLSVLSAWSMMTVIMGRLRCHLRSVPSLTPILPWLSQYCSSSHNFGAFHFRFWQSHPSVEAFRIFVSTALENCHRCCFLTAMLDVLAADLSRDGLIAAPLWNLEDSGRRRRSLP